MYIKYLLLTILCASISNTTLCPPKQNTRTTPYTTDRPHNGIQCLGCEKVFNNKADMRNHFNHTHKKTNFICEYCHKGWSQKIEMKRHLMSKKSRSIHQTDVIKITVHRENRKINKNNLSNEAELKKVLHVNKKQPSIVCNLCSTPLISSKAWLNHVISKHINTAEELSCYHPGCTCLDNTNIMEKLSSIDDKKTRIKTLQEQLHTISKFENNARMNLSLTIKDAIDQAKYPSAQLIITSKQNKTKNPIKCTSCNVTFRAKFVWLLHMTRNKTLNNDEHQKSCYIAECSCLDNIDIKASMEGIKMPNEKAKILKTLMENNGHNQKNNPSMLTLGAHVDEYDDTVPIAQIYTQSSE